MQIIDKSNSTKLQFPNLQLPPLPMKRPLLMIGHGTRNAQGKQALLDFASAYQALDNSRPVLPCFLELTEPTIQEGVGRMHQKRLHRTFSFTDFIVCCKTQQI